MEAKEQAEQLLCEAAEIKGRIEAVEAEAALMIAAIAEIYTVKLGVDKARMKTIEKEIKKLSRKNKKHFFKSDSDRLQLASGALLYNVTKRVKRIRGALAKIEAAGIKNVIKIVKSVNWDAVEKLEDEDLEKIGTCRVKKDVFEYEVGKGKKVKSE